MARPLRIEKVGGWHHVTARGNERKAIFRDDRDRRHFLELLAEMVLRFRVRLHCFVLMLPASIIEENFTPPSSAECARANIPLNE